MSRFLRILLSAGFSGFAALLLVSGALALDVMPVASSNFNDSVRIAQTKKNAQPNRDQKIQNLRELAQQGDASAQYHLGLESLSNYMLAAYWFRLAAEQGHAIAQTFLGLFYAAGKGGLPHNKVEAAKWFRFAAEQGEIDAQYYLGKLYEQGRGVPQNAAIVPQWYHRAVEFLYGVFVFRTADFKDVARDYQKAAEWYRLAAENGHAQGAYNLGRVYFFGGNGIRRDEEKAIKWHRYAAENGHALAKIYYKKGGGVLYETFIDRAEDAFGMIKRLAISDDSGASDGKSAFNEGAKGVFENTWRSVVVVFAGDTQGGGVILGGPNQVATNCHVADKSPYDIRVYKGEGRQANRDEAYSAEIVSGDRKRDVCILSVSGLWGIAAETRAAGDLEIGEAVYAVGAPQGFDFSISDGIVSQLRTMEGESAPLIQTSAAISPGSSGGGLFDSQGRLVGLTTLKIRAGENLNFAIPVDWALELQ